MSAEALIAAARARGLRLASAESCTGGLVAAAVTEAPGASAVFDMGVVTYSNEMKTALLGVLPETLQAHGAVSDEVAAEMAAGARARSGAETAVSVTGIAGPGGSEHKPEGRVCFGLAQSGGITVETIEFGALGRTAVRHAARDHALALMARAVEAVQP